MSENLYFYKGLEESLPTSNIKVGGLYHCTDTGNTYRGISSTEYELYSSTIQTNTGDLVKFKSNLNNSNLSVVSHIAPVQEGEGDPRPNGPNLIADTSYRDESKWYLDDYAQFYVFYIGGSFNNGQYRFSGSTDYEVMLVETNPDLYDWQVVKTFSGIFDEVVELTHLGDIDYGMIGLALAPGAIENSSLTAVIATLDGLRLEKGTGGNIRPITGHSEIKLWRSGKNLFDKNQEIRQIEVYPGTEYPNRWGYELHLPPGNYVGYAYTNNWNTTDEVYVYSKIKHSDGSISAVIHLVVGTTQNEVKYTIEEGDTLFIFNGSRGGTETSSQTLLTDLFNLQIEAGETATTYEPYQGEEFTINLGQTVYSGNFNWTTGKLTIDALDDNENWREAEIVQLTPQQIKALPGINYLYSNCGQTSVQQDFIEPGRLVGKKTSGGGEIFGDYVNNQATGEYSHAEGANTIAGCKGYYIAAIDPTNNYIYLQTNDECVIPTWDNPSEKFVNSFESGYTIYSEEELSNIPYGNEFSVSSNNYYHWPFAGNIVEITGNRIKYESDTLNTSPKWLSNVNNGADPCKFFIPVQSDVGYITVGFGSHAEGWETHAASEHSHAEGWFSITAGRYGHAEGNATRAGFAAHSEGEVTLAIGLSSHAEGSTTTASGDNSHAEGYNTQATGICSHAEGSTVIASGKYSHAEGHYTKATGNWSHTEGSKSEASGNYSHAEGTSFASGVIAHAEGRMTTAAGSSSHSEGYSNIAYNADTHGTTINDIHDNWEAIETGKRFSLAKGNYSHAEGNNNLALGNSSHAEGIETVAHGKASHTEGSYTIASDEYSHAEGFHAVAEGYASHAEGHYTTASGAVSHSEGINTTASGEYSHAEGNNTTASATHTHAEGYGATASGSNSHAEGKNTVASKNNAHAEGESTVASGQASHAEGNSTTAKGTNSHAEGYLTTASGLNSHAEGKSTQAKGNCSHAEGNNTIAFGSSSHVEGKYNIEDIKRNADGTPILDINGKEQPANQYAHIVGNGTSNAVRSNAYTLDWDGNGWYQGGLTIGGAFILSQETYGTELPDNPKVGQIFFKRVTE